MAFKANIKKGDKDPMRIKLEKEELKRKYQAQRDKWDNELCTGF